MVELSSSKTGWSSTRLVLAGLSGHPKGQSLLLLLIPFGVLACAGGGDSSTGGADRDTMECELASGGIYQQALPVTQCIAMQSCDESEVAFSVDIPYCEYADTAYYSETGQLVGFVRGTDTTDQVSCPESGNTSCDSAVRHVGMGCVIYEESPALAECVNNADVQHGLLAESLSAALGLAETRCLATVACGQNEEKYIAVATVEPTDCVDDDSRRYDIFDAVTGVLVTSALDPGQFDTVRPCGQDAVGWSREAVPECLIADYSASEACPFVLGMPVALQELFPED